jgi:hypothetical protein
MKLIAILFFLALLTISFSVMAEPQYWMKKDDYNQLSLDTVAGEECPFTSSDLRNMAEGEYLRARIKPAEFSGALGLSINTTCINIYDNKFRNEGYAIRWDVRFSIRMTMPHIGWVYLAPSNKGIQLTAKGKEEAKALFLDTIRDDLSEALTGYLRINLEEEWEKP